MTVFAFKMSTGQLGTLAKPRERNRLGAAFRSRLAPPGFRSRFPFHHFNTKSIICDANFIVFNTKLMILNTGAADVNGRIARGARR